MANFHAGLVAVALLVSLVSPAGATTFYERPFPETVYDAPIIVRGHVAGKNTDWGVGIDGVKRIYTLYDLDLDEILKGPLAGGRVRMRELGGQKDGLGMQVAGTSKFSQGEEVVVF